MNLGRSAYITQRHQRWQTALKAVDDPTTRAELLSTWVDLTPSDLSSLADIHPPDSAATQQLVAWFTAPVPPDQLDPRPLAEWDLAVLHGVAPVPADARQRHAAALAWLARMGEEVRLREHDAWVHAAPQPHPADAIVGGLWSQLLGSRLDDRAMTQLAALLKPATERAFHAVTRSLGLPPRARDQISRDAVRALQDAALGAHLDLAARTLEAAGEPIGQLVDALPEAAWSTVHRCIARRPAWQSAVPLTEHSVPSACARLTIERLVAHLHQGALTPTTTDLPGWTVVRANRAKLRGRLRATLRDHPGAMLPALLAHPGIAPRTQQAANRWAWDWAWRQARTGFGFSWDGSLSPACQLPDAPEPLAPIGPEHDGVVTTWLLTMLGRGCWNELEDWLAGVPGRSLSTSFYRYLATAPDVLVDAPDAQGRARTYRRLQDHLADGGLDAYVPAIRQAAKALRTLDTGRGLRERVDATLRPIWHPEVPLPEHHLSAFVQRCVGFLADAPS